MPKISDIDGPNSIWTKLPSDTCQAAVSAQRELMCLCRRLTALATLAIKICDGGFPQILRHRTQTIDFNVVPLITTTPTTSAIEDILYYIPCSINRLRRSFIDMDQIRQRYLQRKLYGPSDRNLHIHSGRLQIFLPFLHIDLRWRNSGGMLFPICNYNNYHSSRSAYNKYNSTDKRDPKTYCFPTMRTWMMLTGRVRLGQRKPPILVPGSTINSSTGLYTYTPQDRYPYQAVFWRLRYAINGTPNYCVTADFDRFRMSRSTTLLWLQQTRRLCSGQHAL